MGTRHLETWARGRPPLLAMFAYQVATSAEACFQMCLMARRSEAINGQSEIKPILLHYKNQRRTVNAALETLFPQVEQSGNGLSEIKALGRFASGDRLRKSISLRKFEDMSAIDLVKAINDGKRTAEEIYQKQLNVLRREMAHDTPIPLDAANRLSTPEVRTFCRIFVPCWFEHGRSFHTLLKEATTGNLEGSAQIQALEDVLRLDKLALEHPDIRRLYFLARAPGNLPRRKRIESAEAGGPLRRLTLRKMKLMLGALVSRVFAEAERARNELGKLLALKGIKLDAKRIRLNAPEVRRLFNAVTHDRDDRINDPDLEGLTAHSYYVLMGEELDFWSDLSGLSVFS
jgi:hypothetical protein